MNPTPMNAAERQMSAGHDERGSNTNPDTDGSAGSMNTSTEDVDTPPRDPSPTGELISYKDLEYTPPPGVVSDLAKLDILRVDDGQTRPLVLLVHGGSWASGDKAGFESKVAPWWVEQGYVAAPVNFRLASRMRQTPVVKPSDQVRDLAAALSWLMKHADTYKIATDKIIVLGYSSGAHLVALLGTDERFLRDVGMNEAQIAAVISLDVHVYDVPFALNLMEGSVVENNIPIILHLFGETEMEQLTSSPIQYVDGWAAKSLIVSVDADPNVEGTHGYIVSETAKRYTTALREAGHESDHIHDINETHSSLVGGFGVPGDLVTERIRSFVSELP